MVSLVDNTENLELFISGIFWIPYIVLLFYLYIEHYSRGRNLQSHIILLLSFGAIFRCVWYWIYPFYGKYTYVLAINRIALLLQFSAVTLLVLMWSRALKISKWTDKEYKKLPKNNSSIDQCNSGNIDHKNNHNKYIESLRTANDNAMNKSSKNENKFLVYHIIAIVINIIAWGLVLGTIGEYGFWYDFNIISISMAFAIIAFITLIAGLRISKSLHLSLLPVYISNESSSTFRQQQEDKYACFGRYSRNIEYVCDCFGIYGLLMFIYNPFSISELHHLGLQMQREVLKIILSVSFITFIFFMLRSFCFLYRPMSFQNFNNSTGDALYPFFFYQIPEFIPNLVIAWAISPPFGILRKWVSGIYWVIIKFKMCFKGKGMDSSHRMTAYLEDEHTIANYIGNATECNNNTSIVNDRNKSNSTSGCHRSSTSMKVGSFTNPIHMNLSSAGTMSNDGSNTITSSNHRSYLDEENKSEKKHDNSMRYDTDQESWLAERRLSKEINEILYRINSMSSSRSISNASTLLKIITSDQNENQKYNSKSSEGEMNSNYVEKV